MLNYPKKIPFFLLLFLLLFLFSCLNSSLGRDGISEQNKREDYYLKQINDWNKKENHPRVIELSDIFLRRFPKSELEEKVKSLRLSAVDQLKNEFQQALIDKKYAEALDYYRSLAVLSLEINAAPGFAELYALYALDLADKEFGAAAVSIADKALGLGLEDRQLLQKIIKLALDEKVPLFQRKLLEHLRAKGLNELTDPLLKEAMDFQPSQLVKGTATVIVDRGMKIQNGFGVPDKVIGSAFFIDKRGYLITNYHVIASEVDPEYEGYSRLYIKLNIPGENRLPAKVIGYNQVFDVALLKSEITAEFNFSFLEYKMAEQGDSIYAIGSPAGLESTITSGIVSATGRRFLQMGDALQVDVPVNPGNSGGPLISKQGELIGIVFAGLEIFEGINFAVPSHWIQDFLPQLYKGGDLRFPWLGAGIYEGRDFLEINYIAPGSAAQSAGMQTGDKLIKINGQKVVKISEVQKLLLEASSEELVQLEWEHQGKEKTAYAALRERPPFPVKWALKKDALTHILTPVFGMKLKKIGERAWVDDYVVDKVYPGLMADETGFSKGDSISIRDWKVDEERGIFFLNIRVRKRKNGFLEDNVFMANYLETDSFI